MIQGLEIFKVDSEKYFDLSHAHGESIKRNGWYLLCEDPIRQLVRRYHLKNKKIISLGCGNSFEEYWMQQEGCSLCLNELDTSEVSYLKELNENSQKRDLTYIVGSSALIPKATDLIEQFDCLYVSSFHPDEIRRGKIQAEFKSRRTFSEFFNDRTWPEGEKPYHPILIENLDTVKPGGLAIFQHYSGAVNVIENRSYINDVKNQFSSLGWTLLEFYCFKNSTSNTLVVCYSGPSEEARNFAKALNSPLLEFNGRFKQTGTSNQASILYSIVDSTVQLPAPPRFFYKFSRAFKKVIRKILRK